MGLDLNKIEKRIEDLLTRAGNETTPEEEARTSAVLAARKIREENKKGGHLHVIDVKEYDAVWQKELDDLRIKAGLGESLGQVETLQKELQTARQELQTARQEARAVNELAVKARQREIEARRQIEECQRRADQYANELRSLKARSADASDLARVQIKANALQQELQAAKQEARVASDLVKRARDAEADAKRAEAAAKRAEADAKMQVDACSGLVTKLKSENPSTTELISLQKQVKDLMLKATVAQATARNLASLREEELAYFERERAKKPSPPRDTAYALFTGVLVGGVITMVGAVVFRKIMAPDSSTPPAPPAPSSKPSTYQRTTPGRIAGT